MKVKKPFVSVIIANFNGEKYLPICLDAVLATKYEAFEVVVVDDGSTDTSLKIIKKYCKKNHNILVLQNKKNIGAAASRNNAATVAQGEILIFLDNDTEVTSTWISEMVKTVVKDKKIGGCQALLIDYKKRDQIQVAGTKLWAATGWGLPIGAGMKATTKFTEQNIIALSAALAVRKKVFENVGGFDELEAIVTEDLDLSWRIWVAGYRVVLSPKAIVYHWTKSVAMRKNMKHTNEKIYFHLTKNSLVSQIKNYELKSLFKFLPYAISIHIIRGLFVLFFRKDSSSMTGTMKAFFWTARNLKTILYNRSIISELRKSSDTKLFQTIIQNKSIMYITKNNFNIT